MKCPTCGSGTLVTAVRNFPYTYKGKKSVIKAVKGSPGVGMPLTAVLFDNRTLSAALRT